MLKRLSFFFLIFLITGCNANESFKGQVNPKFQSLSFDVVEKQIIVDTDLPEKVFTLITFWFNEKVKIDGFDGDLIFTVTKFEQDISSIDQGKRVDVSLSFEVSINKPSLSQTKLIKGNISSYGTLTGNFSLAEFDTVIQNTQSDLILRLSKDLKSKI